MNAESDRLMRTAVLTILFAFVLAVPCALPAHAQQDLSRPRSTTTEATPTTGKPATAKEVLSQRLQQLRGERQDRTEARRPSTTVVRAEQLDKSSPQPAESLTVDQAHFEVAEESLATSSTSDLKSQISVSVATPFLDLTQDESLDTVPSTRSSAGDMNADITLKSGRLQVLMRAVAWIVIALCLTSLTLLGLRRWQRRRGLLPTTNAKCKVLETLSLGSGRTVSLIEMAGFRALVASDAGGIRSLVLAPSNFQEELMVAGNDSEADLASGMIAAAA